MRGKREAFILDAGALLDFHRTDRALLALVAKYMAVYVAEPILDHATVLDRSGAAALGIEVHRPEFEIYKRAGAFTRRNPIGFHDWLCLIVAEHEGWSCVSHEPRLHVECASRGIEARWGFELFGPLVDRRVISTTDASAAAQALCKTNRRIPLDKLDECVRQLGRLS